MLTPTVVRKTGVRAARRSATAAEPSLLKPMRLISARSATRRNNRFLGFPGCGSPVTVPISMWSKPSMDMPSMATAFLSKPAASPKGPCIRSPRASVRSSSWRGASAAATKVRSTGVRAASRIHRNARWWACSGSIRLKTSWKKSLYITVSS